MPLPFQKILRRPSMRRFVLPFTIALLLVGFIAFNMMAN